MWFFTKNSSGNRCLLPGTVQLRYNDIVPMYDESIDMFENMCSQHYLSVDLLEIV